MTDSNIAVVTETETAAKAKKPAPVLSAEQAAVAKNLDALKALGKAGITDGAAVDAVNQALVASIAAVGGTVARGNTLFLVRDGVLTTINLTPGTLVRV